VIRRPLQAHAPTVVFDGQFMNADADDQFDVDGEDQ
jgi:hypothetical protein